LLQPDPPLTPTCLCLAIRFSCRWQADNISLDWDNQSVQSVLSCPPQAKLNQAKLNPRRSSGAQPPGRRELECRCPPFRRPVQIWSSMSRCNTDDQSGQMPSGFANGFLLWYPPATQSTRVVVTPFGISSLALTSGCLWPEQLIGVGLKTMEPDRRDTYHSLGFGNYLDSCLWKGRQCFVRADIAASPRSQPHHSGLRSASGRTTPPPHFFQRSPSNRTS
jgi:hypothetical protein